MNAELMEQLILVVHLLLSLAIVGLIMLQQGKGADMGASFGAGASQTLFGSGGSGNVLTQATAWMVALFFATSFALAIVAKNKTSSSDIDMLLPSDRAQQVLDAEVPAVDDVTPSDSDLPALEGGEVFMEGSSTVDNAEGVPAVGGDALDDIPQVDERQ